MIEQDDTEQSGEDQREQARSEYLPPTIIPLGTAKEALATEVSFTIPG
jgi:hypothetical protein